MKIVTSMAPTRIRRQQYCVNSWRKYGHEIVALQPASQVELTKFNFPGITVIESDKVANRLNRPNLIEIYAHLEIASQYDDTILLINSDIELIYSKDEFKYWEEYIPNIFKIGIAHHHAPGSNENKLCPYGITAFQIVPEMVKTFTNIGFAIGCPHWDYWLPYHLSLHNYTIDVDKSMRLMHELHDDRWVDADFLNTTKIFEDSYNISSPELGIWIAKITDRENIQ